MEKQLLLADGRRRVIQGTEGLFDYYAMPALVLFFVILVLLAIAAWFKSPSPNPDWAYWSFQFFLFAIVVTWLGLWVHFKSGRQFTVETGHLGILVVDGERQETPLLKEGKYFVPYVLGGTKLITVDGRHRQLELAPARLASSEGVPVSVRATLSICVINPYAFSGVVEPDKTLLDAATDALRTEVARYAALDVLLSISFTEMVRVAVSKCAAPLGISVVTVSVLELRLPKEVEKYAQVAKLIRANNPDLPMKDVVAALQVEDGRAKKLVLESASIQDAAIKIAEMLFGQRG